MSSKLDDDVEMLELFKFACLGAPGTSRRLNSRRWARPNNEWKLNVAVVLMFERKRNFIEVMRMSQRHLEERPSALSV